MLSGQKHAKRDYEKFKTMSMGQIVTLTREKKTQRKFEDENLEGILKVEKKKAFKKKKTRAQLKEREQEISKLLESPQDIDYDKAMSLYEDQPLEAKEITVKDKRRLNRLKRKAEEENKKQAE